MYLAAVGQQWTLEWLQYLLPYSDSTDHYPECVSCANWFLFHAALFFTFHFLVSCGIISSLSFAFGVLTLMAGHQEKHPAYKN